MEANKIYPEAKNLTYADFPSYFVWHLKTRMWKPRRRGFAIGRITYVPPSLGEVYYLRVLLNIVKGPTSFEEIKTVYGIIHEKFKDACYALGLLDDDREYIEAIKEASLWSSRKYLRRLFSVILLSKSVTTPENVWNATWEILSEDILYNQRKKKKNPRKIHLIPKLFLIIYLLALCHQAYVQSVEFHLLFFLQI